MPTVVRRCRRLGALASSRFFSLVSLAIRESTQSGGLRKRIAQVGLYSPHGPSAFSVAKPHRNGLRNTTAQTDRCPCSLIRF